MSRKGQVNGCKLCHERGHNIGSYKRRETNEGDGGATEQSGNLKWKVNKMIREEMINVRALVLLTTWYLKVLVLIITRYFNNKRVNNVPEAARIEVVLTKCPIQDAATKSLRPKKP
ncbi:hypothetical protein ACH5RR_029621 [Cinchona calisaya]|uniref:Uncharacterized protein n=1 Tax=Cinchona calisaya TaxID=153742 RepID=A0ABD2YW10_9GENT